MSSGQKIMHPAQPLYQEFRLLARKALDLHVDGDFDKSVEYAQQANLILLVAALQGHPTAARLFSCISKVKNAEVPVVGADFTIKKVPFRIKLENATLPPLTPYPPLPSP
jgi:hypothetical protein